jgi:hypothetical protein
MQSIQETLSSLKEDGILYAHFFINPAYPDYYGVWVKERTPEYITTWLPHSQISNYKLAFSVEMPDSSFFDYLKETYKDQIEVRYLKAIFKIGDLYDPQMLVKDFKEWKQEKIRLNRSKWLEQCLWEAKELKGV